MVTICDSVRLESIFFVTQDKKHLEVWLKDIYIQVKL